jgi:tRNA dimethylallyltransferase
MIKPTAVLIAGPTASGKSRAALALAEAIGGEIVNADSMQIYRELRVLTARPSDADMARVPHHLYGHVSVREAYSVARYQADAARTIDDVRARGRVPVVTGGTGLYFAALTDGLADIPPVPAPVREAARKKLERIGVAGLHAELAARDPQAGQALRPSDRQRVLRAYEVLEATGRSLLAWQKSAGRPVLTAGETARFVIDVPREELRARIATRFGAMVEAGAGAEAAALGDLDPALPSAKILGLRELAAAHRGEMPAEEAVTLAVTRTRQYAKRQVTWFRHRMADWTWVSGLSDSNILAEMLKSLT